MSLEADVGSSGHEERTMVVDTRLLKRSAKSWRPYTFKLEKVSLNDTRLAERMKWLKPKAEAIEALCSRLKSIFDAQVGFSQESVRVLAPADLRRQLAERGAGARAAPGPRGGGYAAGWRG